MGNSYTYFGVLECLFISMEFDKNVRYFYHIYYFPMYSYKLLEYVLCTQESKVYFSKNTNQGMYWSKHWSIYCLVEEINPT